MSCLHLGKEVAQSQQFSFLIISVRGVFLYSRQDQLFIVTARGAISITARVFFKNHGKTSFYKTPQDTGDPLKQRKRRFRRAYSYSGVMRSLCSTTFCNSYGQYTCAADTCSSFYFVSSLRLPSRTCQTIELHPTALAVFVGSSFPPLSATS